MKFEEILQTGQYLLFRNDIDVKEARMLLAYVLNIDVEKIITFDKKKEIPDKFFKKYLALLEKRISGIPYAYIINNKEFMGLNFYVDEHVLVPRPDTEILVENVASLKVKSILDLCTGSGCIAISLAKLMPGVEITASDISEEALKVAKKNAELHGVKIKYIKSDLFEHINGKFDAIVSNPPYIKTEEIKTLQKEVRCEPILALDGGEDGLNFYRRIIKDAKDHLNNGGYIALEIGYNQRYDVSALLNENGYKDIKVIKDYEENNRVLIATI
jgi:release factor glutamine methyltransferase